MLKATYKKAVPANSFLMRVYVSMLNAENVVNPPKKPIIKNSFNGYFGEFMILLFINNPIIKQPTILIANVPIGKSIIKNLLNSIEHKYRNMEPINPPAPIDNNNFNLN